MVVDEKTDFRQLARNGGLVLSYRAGDFIFREGDTASCMYIVLKGSVEMSTRDKVVVTIPEGKPFGMISLIDKKPRANTARAIESGCAVGPRAVPPPKPADRAKARH